MRFCFILLLMLNTGISLAPVRFAWGHDCPLEDMARLETFRVLDKNQDRRLNLEEFMAQDWCQEAPSCQCQEAARQFFQRLDQNRDGFVTLEEHQTLARERHQRGK